MDRRTKILELELKKTEPELKIIEQRTRVILNPVLLSIPGGIIILVTGLILIKMKRKTPLNWRTKNSRPQ